MSRSRISTILRTTLALLVVAAVAVAVARNWAAVSADIDKVEGGTFVLAAALACIPPVLTMLGWRVLLAELGSPLHVAPAGGVFFVGQLGKYLPGAVWSIVAQAEMGARLHIPRRRSAVVAFLAVAIAAICGLVVGLPAVPLLLTGGDASTTGWLALLAVPVLGLTFYPPLLNWGVATVLRVLRREPLEQRLSGRAVAKASGLFVLTWLSSGLHALVLLKAIGATHPDSPVLLVATLSGFALASSLAMFSVVLPAGVGVREGLLVLMLAPISSTSAATAVVVLSRFLTVLADVLFALLGWAYARRHHLITTREERERDHVVVDDATAG